MTDPGPLCSACGCYMAEHQSEIDHEWRRIHGRCLTCECDQFEPSEALDTRETVEADR